MKLVQLLAKELKEWPEGVTHLTQSEVTNEIYNALEGNSEGAIDSLDHRFNTSSLHSERPYPIVSREQWYAEREKMNKPKWIRHRGGNRPIEDNLTIEIRWRDGEVGVKRSGNVKWKHEQRDYDIMAYRVIEEAKDQEIEELKKTNFGTITYKLEIDATEATQRIDSLVAKWGQIESPLKWRDEIIELEAYEEEFRREREKLIRKLESEGFKLIDQISCNLDKIDQALEYSVDMSDWRNWQPGDIVECLIVPAKHEGYYLSGINYKIKKIDLDDEGSETEIDVYCGGDMALWCPSSSFSFIRRP